MAGDPVSNILQAALHYAESGVPVCATDPGSSKRPRPGLGSLHASTDPDVIRGWWARWPDSNIAMRSGVVYDVLDVDVRHGQPGWASLARVAAAGLLEGAGRRVRTPSGGGHLYFQSTCRASSAIVGSGLELKSRNVLVTVPPSAIEGSPYVMTTDRPATAPLDWDAVVELLRPRVPVQVERTWDVTADVAALVRHVDQLEPGNRNRGLFWAACRAVESGGDLRELADAGRRIGLPGVEIESVLRSARRTARVAA